LTEPYMGGELARP